jgi:hypothetical protein
VTTARSSFLWAVPLGFVLAANLALAVEPSPTITKCQMADGTLYFGPAPPPGCRKLAQYKDGRELKPGADQAEPAPTPEAPAEGE